MTIEGRDRQYYYGLDLVRFVTALMVAVFHIAFTAWPYPETIGFHHAGSYRFPELAAFTWFGWVGVPTFFVLSGFVIANSAEASDPWRFLKSRVSRLYPAVWICAALTGVVKLVTGELPFRDVLYQYVHSAVLWPTGPFMDGPYWTLPVEIVFYSLVLLLLLSIGFRHADSSRLRARRRERSLSIHVGDSAR